MFIGSQTSNADRNMTRIAVHFTSLVVMRGTSRVDRGGFEKPSNIEIFGFVRKRVFSHACLTQIDETRITVHLYHGGFTQVTSYQVLGTGTGVHHQIYL
jgi:uncharacterized protein YdaL